MCAQPWRHPIIFDIITSTYTARLCEFYVFSGHKCLMAPHGMRRLTYREKTVSHMHLRRLYTLSPPIRTQLGSEDGCVMFSSLHRNDPEFKSPGVYLLFDFRRTSTHCYNWCYALPRISARLRKQSMTSGCTLIGIASVGWKSPRYYCSCGDHFLPNY